jgi:predicted adenine nucleotide alpha hydrolase (AANH) superfamily ATPase
MIKMTRPQQQRYLNYISDFREDKEAYYTKSDITKFNHYDKRLALLREKLNNEFALQEVVKHIFNGEYLYSIDTFAAYLFLNYKKTETTLTRILNTMGEFGIYHYDECVQMCLGISAYYQTKNGYDYFHATFTHDLELVNIKF